MPQTKQAKRKTAIRLYEDALLMHKHAIPGAKAIHVPIHESCISNLKKMIRATEAKLKSGA